MKPKFNYLNMEKALRLFLPLLLLILNQYDLNALNPGAVTITNKSGPSFILDSNNPCNQGPVASYVAYEICNNTANQLSGLTATLGGLSTGFTLHNGQLVTQNIGTLAAGGCKMVYWYVKYPCTFNQTTNITITVADPQPGAVSATNQVKTTSNLSASAGGQLIGATLGPVPFLGGTTWIDVEYSFGNIPKSGIAYFQPAGNTNFNAGCMQLVGFEVVSSQIPQTIAVGVTNRLYFTAPSAAGGSSHRIVVRFYFQIICPSFETTLLPFAAATSGNPVKFSDNYGFLNIKVPADFLAANGCDGNYDDFAIQVIGTSIGLENAEDNWSASWGDYNGDGYPDLFVTTHDANQANSLYKNNGNGTFARITTGSIATDMASSLASTWGDYDNDGDLDLYVANNIGFPNFLYRNEGSNNFTRILNDPAVADLGYAHGASWVDYDNDGYLDLFVGSYFETLFNQLYHNNGDGTFTKVTNNPIVNEASATVTGVWGDYNNDGLPDLFVANARGFNNSLYRNTGNGTFQKITTGAIVTDGGTSVGASWGDYDNDRDLDLFVANAGGINNFLYRNNGNGTFTKITSGSIVNDGGQSHGSAWADFDSDGDLDLFVANDGHSNFLYRNDGGGNFTKITEGPAVNSNAKSFGCAWADYDRDGDPDLFVANRDNQQNLLFKNEKGTCNNRINIKLIGSRSNRSAIGAKVFVKATIDSASVWQMREVTAQSGGGTGGQSDLRATFGLGNATMIDSITVLWPSGYRQVLTNQLVNQFLTITEDNASKVCGMVYNDVNGDCRWSAGEPLIANAKIVLQPGNITAYTDDSGNYEVYVQPGTYGIQEFPGENWLPRCPNTNGTATVTVTGFGGQFCGFDFGNTAQCAGPDLKPVVAVTAHRVGFENLMVVNYENAGAATATNPVLTLTPDPFMSVVESTLPWNEVNEGRLQWNLPSLAPGSKGTIYLKYYIASGTDIGQNIQVNANLTCTENDCYAANDGFQEVSLTVGAIDPNDMLVSPEGAVGKNEFLVYKIRFQNVGNSPATMVRVENSLPAGLDLSTLETGSVSHAYQFQADGRKLTWTFPNINLPDSIHNEPQSHGYIMFRIKPKQSLLPGDKIINSAVIYFDNMEGIVTNEVVNFIRSEVKGNSYGFQSLDVFPNPATDLVTVKIAGPALQGNSEFQTLKVFDMQGRPVLEKNSISGTRVQLDLKGLPTGNYHVKALDQLGRQYIGKIVLLR
jgi:uncharacterized repeat protein (TIGR01451 family)